MPGRSSGRECQLAHWKASSKKDCVNKLKKRLREADTLVASYGSEVVNVGYDDTKSVKSPRGTQEEGLHQEAEEEATCVREEGKLGDSE